MIAFLVPIESSEKPLFSYMVSVDLIEQKAGIDFFPALEDSIGNKLEKSIDRYPWFNR
jgi:endonuclease G